MEKEPSFRDTLAKIRDLIPPKNANKHDPRYQAQKALQDMAHGHPVRLSEAQWRALPGAIKFRALRYTRDGENCRCFVLAGSARKAAGVLHWLSRRGWRHPTAPCEPAQRDRGSTKAGGGDHG